MWERIQPSVASPPTPRDLACNPGMCPDQELNWRPSGPPAGAHSTEPRQPGHDFPNTLFCSSLYGKNIGCTAYKVQNTG